MTPDTPETPDSKDESGEKKPVDLRFTSVNQSGVSINRDMSGQGHLARGSRTNMSNMRFSIQAKPRAEPDPELQALRDQAPAAPAQPPAAAPAAAGPAASAPDDAPQNGGVLDAIKRLFR